MKVTIRGKNLDVSDRDRQYVERKLQRLERVLDDRSEAEVELREEGRRKVDDTHIVAVTLVIDGQVLRGTATASSFRAATDIVIDKLERRTVDHKHRPRDRARADQARYAETATSGMIEPQPGADETSESAADPLVVKVKRFAIEPMFEEDAITRMEELGHTFFIFVNAENERVAVLYRRRDGRYGLIEPTIGGAYSASV